MRVGLSFRSAPINGSPQGLSQIIGDKGVWHSWIGIIGRQRRQRLMCLRMNLKSLLYAREVRGR